MKKNISVIFILMFVIFTASCQNNKQYLTDNGSVDERFNITGDFQKSLTTAKKRDVVIVNDDYTCIHGKSLFDDFAKKVQNNEPSSVVVANCYYLNKENVSPEYYESEKENYPKLFFTKTVYDGEIFKASSRECKSSTSELEDTAEFKYMLHFSDTIPSGKTIERYVLTNDDTLTWEEIMRGMFSSQSGDYIDHFTVISYQSEGDTE